MKRLPTCADSKGRTFTIGDFLEAAGVDLRLDIVAGGEHRAQPVREPATNRPGLALTGFFEHFAANRLQLFGYPEIAYLESVGEAAGRERLRALFRHGAYCLITTNGIRPPAYVAPLASQAGAVVLSTPLMTRDFAHLAAFALERMAAPVTSIYGTMVEVCGLGVLFEGDPGLGKSETALGLVKRGAALVADDLTCIRKAFGCDILYGSASEATAGYMEIRGIGIMDIRKIFGVNAVRAEKRLQLVVTFRRMRDVLGEIDRIGQTRRMRSILGVGIPNVIIPVSEGRDLVNLVETAVQQQKLIMTGYDPVENLSEHLRLRASGGLPTAQSAVASAEGTPAAKKQRISKAKKSKGGR